MLAAHRYVLGLACALSLIACSRPAPSGDTASAGRVFLAKNALTPGVRVTASGLQYRVLRSGPVGGLRPKAADEVKVNYEGKLLDGEVFDSSFERGTPAVMGLRGVIPGWSEALQLMRPGDEWLLYVPAALGYGDRSVGPIPPGSVLVFKVDLIDVLPDAQTGGRS
jgi:peptidylprolyl isomerase/FKBP-type peptidyl-prolyl cis-trans isomerase FklB